MSIVMMLGLAACGGAATEGEAGDAGGGCGVAGGRCFRPQVDPFGYQRTPVGSICGPLAEFGRRCCGADVAGWLNATVPAGLGLVVAGVAALQLGATSV